MRNSKIKFVRQNLEGEKLGGVELYKKIGSGGFGDVYIDRKFKLVVKVVWADPDPESYRNEYKAVSQIANRVRQYSNIQKILDIGTNGELEVWSGFHHAHPESSEILKHPTLVDHARQRTEDRHEFFYYLMTAADNRLHSSEKYEPDTLAERKAHGELDHNLSPEQEKRLSAQMLDCLLNLFRMGFTHGDLKLSNIFFVNGQISFGDIGCTLYYPGKDSNGAYYHTDNYAPPRPVFLEWVEKCKGDLLAANMLKDIYMLGRTIRFLKEDVHPAIYENENGLLLFDMPKSPLASELEDFAGERAFWTTEFIIKHLQLIRNRFSSMKQLPAEAFLQPMAEIELRSFLEFQNEWCIVKQLTAFSFLVTKAVCDIQTKDCDILLAERVSPRYYEDICDWDELIVQHRDDGKEKILLLYKLPNSLIILTHAPNCRGNAVQTFLPRNFEGYSASGRYRDHGGKKTEIYWSLPCEPSFNSNFASVCDAVPAEKAESFILDLFKDLCKHIVVNKYRAHGDICAQNIRFEKNVFEFRNIHWNDSMFEEDELLGRKPFHVPPDDIADTMKRTCVSHNDYCVLLDFFGLAKTIRGQFPALPPRISAFCDAMETVYARAANPLTASKIVSGLKYTRHCIFDQR